MVPSSSKDKRKKKNKSRRQQLEARSQHFYRRKEGLGIDDDEVEIAGYLRRTGQYFIDVIISSFITLIFLALLEVLTGDSDFPPVLYIFPQLIVGIVYFIPLWNKSGQTYGCKKMGIVVIKSDGSGYLNKLGCLIRWGTLYFIPNVYALFMTQSQTFAEQASLAIFGMIVTVAILLPIFITSKRQGIHDKLAGSIVVRAW